MNKSLCAFPFFGSAIRPNGLTIPCCRYPHIDDPDSYVWNENVRNTPHWKKLREKMLKGEPVEGCASCYQDEANGLFSMRLDSLQKFVPTENKIIPVEQLEISFSNLCNLACVHCSSFFSSKWQAENKKNGREEKKGFIQNNFDFTKWDLSKVKNLKIIGGEPFMEQDKFKSLLRSINLQNIHLQICTNGTILPDNELKELIEQCRTVGLFISLDGIYETNNWYRWPSKFNECIEIIRTYEEWWKNNKQIKLYIHTVINNINVLDLEKFLIFLENDLPLWKVEWDWIRWPHWQQLNSLPDTVKDKLINDFSRLNLNYKYNKVENPYKVTVERLQETRAETWSNVKKNILQISNERKLDFLKMVPSFKEIWKINE